MTLPDNLQNVPQNAYFKTSVGLTMLRETILGRQLFDAAFREYCRRWAFRRAEPADFFRTIEDASGMDLDWFWRGWFFSTAFSDVEVVAVVKRRISDGDPAKAGEREKEKEARLPKSITHEREAGTPRRIEKFPELKDFYDAFDPHAPTDKQNDDFRKFLDRLTPEEKQALKFDRPIYEVKLKNHGQLPMPLILKLEFDDQSMEIRRYPAEIWRAANGEMSTLVLAPKPVVAVMVDPYNETADTNYGNNRFPRLIDQTDLQITKPPVKIENPLHDAQEKEKKGKEQKPATSRPRRHSLTACAAAGVLVVQMSSPMPAMLLISEPASVPIFPASSAAAGSASPARNSDIVKPMPARQAPPAKTPQVRDSGRRASPTAIARDENSRMPTGFPRASPAATAMATGSRRAASSMGTPAFANAKIA